MGTRHLIAAVIDGDYKIAQYGQWDGYPTGKGVAVLQFLRETMNRPVFEWKLRNTKFITQEDLDQILAALGSHDGDLTNEQSKQFFGTYPQMSRDVSAKVLAFVQEHEAGILLRDSRDFAGDSLMCEYAYVIDLDKNTFEIFKGFNHEQLDPSERFASIPYEHRDYLEKEGSKQYHQVKHWKTYQLDQLPTPEQFLKDLDESEDEEQDEAA